MKIFQINATCGVGSTGKICVSISELLVASDIENYILYSTDTNGYHLGIPCSNRREIRLEALKSRLLGNYGFNSRKATKRLIIELERINPRIVHIHNIHGHDCNLEMLFGYLKSKKIRLIWTFHDCWAFTAYCSYFTLAKCNKWENECRSCVSYRESSWFFDKSSKLYQRKKDLFTGLDLTVVTPSEWLAGLVNKSFLKNCPVKVINNGIDLNVFKPMTSDFREKHNISKKKMLLLGVAFDWGVRKGLDVFVELSKRLDNGRYQIVLVGTDERIDESLPENIISIHRTQSPKELAQIYTAADVFVNPTREENYPTVNMEAIACGTPVITFNTGGSPEIIDETCGSVVDQNDIDALEKEIIRVCETKPYSSDACCLKAQNFDCNVRFREYINLYEEMMNDRASEG